MSVSSLASTLRQLSFQQVIVRARQYPLEHGRWSHSQKVPGGMLTQGGPRYVVADEIQAIACCSLTYHGVKDGFIMLRYNNPPPQPYFTRKGQYRKQHKLRSVIWTGNESIEEAWRLVCDSWVNCPNWLSPKPVVLCRQFHPDGEYTNAPVSDLLFLRRLDHLALQTRQHRQYHDNWMEQLACETPMDRRGKVYVAHLHNSNTRGSLLGSIASRLKTLVDAQFAELTSRLEVEDVQPLQLVRA